MSEDPFDFPPLDHRVPLTPDRKRVSRQASEEVADVAEYGTPEYGGGKKKRKVPSYNKKVRQILTERKVPFCNVEQYNAFSGKKSDLFGFADFIILDGCIVALQVTSQANLSGHLSKIVNNPSILEACRMWIEYGRFEMWGLKKNEKGRYDITQHVITHEVLENAIKGGRMKWKG